MVDTVKIKLELGEVELSFEGPAAFARDELSALVENLVERLAAARPIIVDDYAVFAESDEADDEEEEDAGVGEGAPDPRRGH